MYLVRGSRRQNGTSTAAQDSGLPEGSSGFPDGSSSGKGISGICDSAKKGPAAGGYPMF